MGIDEFNVAYHTLERHQVRRVIEASEAMMRAGRAANGKSDATGNYATCRSRSGIPSLFRSGIPGLTRAGIHNTYSSGSILSNAPSASSVIT